METQIKNLFQFLKSFQGLKTKPKYDVESYQKVLWFYDIPKYKECFSIVQKIATEKSNKNFENFNKWIEIKKPKREICPKVPKEIIAWLKDEKLNNPEKPPQLFTSIPKNLPANVEKSTNEEDNKIFLKDYPKIQQAFENYLNQKWAPWAKEEKRLKPILKLYNELYDIYRKNETLGEVYQIVLGLGLLSAKNQQGKDIKRHIVTTPLSIDFDSVRGTITIGPCKEQDVELCLEMDMLKENEKPRNSDTINSQLSDLSNDFWLEGDFYNHLKSWLNSYDSDGQFILNFEKPETRPYTTLNICPAIILRKRDQRDFLKFYDSVIEDIKRKTSMNLPIKNEFPCLKNLVGDIKDSPDRTEINKTENGKLSEKHYFPLPANEEQKKIIKK